MAKLEQWEGFQGKTGLIPQMYVTSFSATTHHMTEMKLSWRDLQRQQINCGENCRSCRKKNVQKAAFWIWKQKQFPVSQHKARDSIDESMKDLEAVVGLQTDKPLKRAFMPYGGIKMAEKACTTHGYTPSEKLHEIFTKYHKTHNQGVFDIYTDEMKVARHNKIITGLLWIHIAFCGRIVGDYRRVALYGIDFQGRKTLRYETLRKTWNERN